MPLTKREFIQTLMNYYSVNKQTALAPKIGVDQSTVSRIKRGREVFHETAHKISETTGLLLEDICEVFVLPYGSEERAADSRLKSSGAWISLDQMIKTISDRNKETRAGHEGDSLLAILEEFGPVTRRPRRRRLGSVPAGLPEDREAVFREAREGPFDYELTVKGDSMEPDFYDGDCVIVRPDLKAKNGDFVIATVNGENVLKQLASIKENGETIYCLKPSNGKYREIKEGDITIQGVVSRIEMPAKEAAEMRRELDELRKQAKK